MDLKKARAALKKAFFKITGGRPMVRDGHALFDTVVGREVYYWRDRLGRRWMAFGRWDLFRVEARSKESFP